MEQHGSAVKLIKSSIFYNNPHIIQDFNGDFGVQIQLNNPHANYCLKDMPDRAIHKQGKHIIEGLCEVYGFNNPKLKCEIFLDENEQKNVDKICETLKDRFITIEPSSNFDYTVNRIYPFEKWQNVVNELSKNIQIVQIGMKDSKLLNNVVDLRGKTSFRTASGVIGKSELFIASEGGLVHASTATNTTAVVIITGYQTEKMVSYPQNININIANHGPCGLKANCLDCQRDASSHDEKIILEKINKVLNF